MNANLVKIQDLAHLTNKDFSNEIDLCKYIVANISNFTRDVLNDVYVDHVIEKPLKEIFRFGPRPKRIDLVIYCDTATYIIELKCPKYVSENRKAIGQILDYAREFPDPLKKMVLITTKFDIDTALTIDHYELPIQYIYFERARSFEYKEAV